MRMLLLVTTASLMLLVTPSAFAEVLFVPVGDIPGEGIRSGATSISRDGTVAAGAGTSTDSGANGREALRWDNDDGAVGLGSLPGGAFWSYAHGVSSDGSYLVGESSGVASGSNSAEAALWSDLDDEIISLGDLPGGAVRGSANAVSDDGSIVVGASSSSSSGAANEEPFIWRMDDVDLDGVMEGLGSLPGGGFFGSANGVSADGTIVVGGSSSTSSGNGQTEAFRWEDDVMEALGDLSGGRFDSSALAISGDGLVIVGRGAVTASGAGFEAFRWEDDEMEGLGDLPGGQYNGEALATNDDGSLVVGRSSSTSSGAGETEAFVWDAVNGMQSMADVLEDAGIDLGTWRLTAATGISGDGTVIVGTGVNNSSNDEGWVALFLPEPTNAPLSAAALLTLAALSRRSQGRRFSGNGKS